MDTATHAEDLDLLTDEELMWFYHGCMKIIFDPVRITKITLEEKYSHVDLSEYPNLRIIDLERFSGTATRKLEKSSNLLVYSP